MNKNKFSQEEIVNYLKNYGFVYPNSEIYGGLANAWDYGPLGVLLKNNIKKSWWNFFVTSEKNVVGIDSSIIMNPIVWKSSGHLDNFSDPLIDCKECKSRFRADKIIEQANIDVQINENTSFSELTKIIEENRIVCPNCGKFNWTNIRNFNLMFETNQGVVEGKLNKIYLRPETAQGIFINFSNVVRTSRMKLPFGIGQIGKSFRNEITPGNFIFRTREFEQMELEYFCKKNDSNDAFNKYQKKISNFLENVLNISKENIKIIEHNKNDLSHYSSKTIDYQFNFPHGWSELWGLANRTDYDLKKHQEISGKNLWILDPITNEKIIPYVIEPSVGVERLFYALIVDKFSIEKIEDEERIVLHLPFSLAPYKVAILPLVNKLSSNAEKILNLLLTNNISATFDSSGTIGKRYRRQDAIGTPYCITFDFDSLENNEVTIRERDTMKQIRIKVSEIINFLNSKK